MTKINDYKTKIAVYLELIDSLLIMDEAFENIDKYHNFIYDPIYIDLLNSKVDELCKYNYYSKAIIDKLKAIIRKYQEYLIVNIDDNIDLIKRYDEIYDKLDTINDFNDDYLLIDYRLKYDRLDNVDKLAGVPFKEMTKSMLYDYPILISIIDGEILDNIEYKYYPLSIKKLLYIFPSLFNEVPSVKRNTKKVLNTIISESNDTHIIRECKKILLSLKYKQADYDAVEFAAFYYKSTILGLVVNYDFNNMFDKIDDKIIMSEDFIEVLEEVIESCNNRFDQRIVANLMSIVNCIQMNLKNYYEDNERHELTERLNNMKINLNSQNGNNRDYHVSNIIIRENRINYLKYVFYSLAPKRHVQDFLDIEREILEDEYTLSEILKSFTVSDEEFMASYYKKFLYDENFIKSIRKLLIIYPSIFKEDIAYDRTRKVIIDELDRQKEDNCLTIHYKIENKILLKKLDKYNISPR